MAKKKAAELNARQARFVEEYLVDGVATQAAVRAGYSPRTAESQGCRLLRNAKVAAAIAAAREKRSERTGITVDEILGELARVGFDMDEDTKNRLKALELAGKHLGMFKTIISGDPDAPIVPNRPYEGLSKAEIRSLLKLEAKLERLANDGGE